MTQADFEALREKCIAYTQRVAVQDTEIAVLRGKLDAIRTAITNMGVPTLSKLTALLNLIKESLGI